MPDAAAVKKASVELKSLAFPRASASGIAPAERGFLRFEGSRVHLKTYPTPSVCFLRDATPVPRPSPRLRRSGLQHLVRARNRLAPTGSGVTAMNQGRLAACTSRRWRDTAQRSIHLPRYWRTGDVLILRSRSHPRATVHRLSRRFGRFRR
jgi:hypothetical protein